MKKVLSALALGASLTLGGVAMAEEAAPNTGALTFSGGMDFVTSYVFRGYEIQDTGFLAQPYFQLSAKMYESDAITISPYVGIWNSLQDNQKNAGDSNWYESDIFAGVQYKLPGGFSLTSIFTMYTYPGQASENVQELGLKVGYDDTEIMKKNNVPFAVKPYAAFYREILNDNDVDEAQYFELGIAPTFALGDTGMTLAIPVTAGFSPDGYYQDEDGHNESFGFFSVGAMVSYPLPVPAKFGSWTVTAGVTYYSMSAKSAELANDDDDSEISGILGLGFSY